MILFISFFLCLNIQNAIASDIRSITVSEPDPSASPATDKILVDDRQICPEGQRRYQKMKCAMPKEKESRTDCDSFHAVLICSEKPLSIKCSPPHVAVPETECEKVQR